MLPDGSAYVRATAPARAWNQEQHNTADLVDTLWEIQALRAGKDPSKAPHIRRPAQIAAAAEARSRARRAKNLIENAEWVEVE